MPQWYTRHRWLGLLVVVGLVAMLAFAACNGDDDEEVPATPTPDNGNGVDPPTDQLIIGVLMPFTGDLGEFGPFFVDSMQLAVDEINEAGGVLGNQVILVTADTATSPAQGVEEARRLVDIEGVHAIVGAAASGVSLAVAESVTGPEGILQISPASTSPALTDVPAVYRTTISDAAQGLILARQLEEEGIESVCSLYVNNAYGQGLSDALVEHFTGTVTAQVPHEELQTTYAAELGQCGEAEALAALAYPASAGVFLREAVEGDMFPQFVFVDGTKSPAMLDDLGWDNFDGMVGTDPGALDVPESRRFDDRFEDVTGESVRYPFQRQAYDAVFLVALAAEKAGVLERTAIRDAVRDIANPPGEEWHPSDGWDRALEIIAAGDDINYEGASGPVDLDENGDVLIGAIEFWRIDAAAEEFATVAIFRVDLQTLEVERLE